jgi:hypothetical protein
MFSEPSKIVFSVLVLFLTTVYIFRRTNGELEE